MFTELYILEDMSVGWLIWSAEPRHDDPVLHEMVTDPQQWLSYVWQVGMAQIHTTLLAAGISKDDYGN